MRLWKTFDNISWTQISVNATNQDSNYFGIVAYKYVDLLPASGFVNYMVEFVYTSSCQPSPQRSASYNTIFSNRVLVSTIPGLTNISKTGTPNFEIYPNPANDQLTIRTADFAPEVLSIYNLSGQKVSETKFFPQLDISALGSGIYFIEVKGALATGRKMFVKM